MSKISSNTNLDLEQKLWATADKLRNNMDAAEYKHVVLGLIFLKYISDAFEEKHKLLSTDNEADPEDKDEYLAENIGSGFHKMINGWDEYCHLKPLIEGDFDYYKIVFPTTTTTKTTIKTTTKKIMKKLF